MLRSVGDRVDASLTRTRLGQLLRNQRIDIVSRLEGCDRPFAQTSLAWSGDVTTMICGRRCAAADVCACGLTGQTDRWATILPIHRRRLESEAVRAFHHARQLARRIRLWVPLFAGAVTAPWLIGSGSWTEAMRPAAIAALVSLAGRSALVLAAWWLHRRAVRRGLT